MIMTKSYLERLIQKAKDASVDPKYITELEEQLKDLQSGSLNRQSDKEVYSYEYKDVDGKRVVRVSTAPIDPEHDHVFDDIPLKRVKTTKK